MWGHQRDQSTSVGGNAAGINDSRTGIAGLVEDQLALHEVVVVYVGCARNEAADVDLGALAEDNAVGIDEEYLTVGVHAA